MITNIKKEFKMATRTGKIIAILAACLFFAMSTPIMTKFLLPEIMKSQFPGITQEVLEEMIDFSQLGNITSYLGDLQQIVSIVVAFVLGGLLAAEIKENTLVLPVCSGKKFFGIIMSKLIVFGSLVFVAPIIGMLVNYYYAGILFSFDIGVLPVIAAGMLYGMYYLIMVALVLLFGTFIKSPIATGFITLGVTFSTFFVADIFKIHKYLPSGLLVQARNVLAEFKTSELISTILFSVIFLAVIVLLAFSFLRKKELNQR